MFMDRVKMATTRKYVVGLLLIFIVEISAQQFVDGPTASESSYEATISWSYYNPFELLEYAVFYTLINKDQCHAVDEGVNVEQQTDWGYKGCSFTANVNTCSININGLVPYSTYSYYVKAQSQGSSYKSREATFRTNEAEPTLAPAIKQETIEATQTSVTISFIIIPCGKRRGATQYEYEITHYPSGANVINPMFQASVDNDIVTVILSNLPCRSVYTFKVWGFNDNFNLPGPSSSTQVTTINYNWLNISSCQDITRGVSKGMTTDIGAYPTTVTGGTGPYTILFNPPLDTPYGVGTQTVTVTAYDSRCGTGSCMFSIDVNESNFYPPATVEWESVLTTSITFEWSEATCPEPCPNGITGYSYRLIALPSINGEVMTGTVGANEKMVTFRGLSACSQYVFSVAGVSGTNTGIFSNPITATTAGEQLDRPPLSVMVTDVSQRQVSFSWTEAVCVDMYSYQLMDLRTNNVIMGETSDNTISINNLTPYVNYSFRVAAVNSAGQGPFSDSIMSRTLEDVPTAPIGLTAPNSDTTSITIEWLEPNPPHGVIIKYHIEYWKTSESMNTTMSAMTDEPTFTISGLQPYDEYSFRVQAETSVGRGDWSTTITAAAMEGLPSMPVNLKAYAAENSITITWNTPVYPNGIIIGYMIKYQALEKGFDVDFIPDDKYTLTNPVSAAEDTLVVVDKLEPSTKYEFRVSGRTSAGQGEEAVIDVYTATYTFDESYAPDQPSVGLSDQSVAIDLPALHKYTSNVYVAVENAANTARNTRAPEDTLVANLTRSDVDDNENFIIGDNKTYGGYQNQALIGGEDYVVMVQYASCTPVEECSTTRWSNPTTFTGPTLKPMMNTQSSSYVIAIAISIILVVIIPLVVFICFIGRRRRQQSPTHTSPKSDEAYDEIDARIANKSTKQNDTGYEVNLAMEGIKTSNQYEEDYEDVKRESAYQEMNTGNVEAENTYQGLGETEQKNESDYQGLSKADMDKEHDYQDLGQKSDNDRKTSIQYVNVAI